jgi:hypothetical protein
LFDPQKIRPIGIFEHGELEALFPVSVPGILQIRIPVLSSTQRSAVLIPPFAEIHGAANIQLTCRSTEDLIDARHTG